MMARAATVTVAVALGLSGLALAATLPLQDDGGSPRTTVAEAGLPEVQTQTDWRAAPVTPGDWFYEEEGEETLALFGTSATAPMLMIRCDKSTRQVGIAVIAEAAAATTMHIRTDAQDREVPLNLLPGTGERADLLVAQFAAFDDLLDAIAFSRGRFALEIAAQDNLYVPAWPEITRVVEDCR